MSNDKRLRAPTVAIELDVYEQAKRKAGERLMEVKQYINEVLRLNLEKDDLLKVIAPRFSLVGKSPQSLLIRDDKQGRTAEVVLKDGNLQCYLCEKNDCEHIRYALALPELGHLRPRKK